MYISVFVCSLKEILRCERLRLIQHSAVDMTTLFFVGVDRIHLLEGLFSTARNNLPIADVSKTENPDDWTGNQHGFVVEQLKCPPTDHSSHAEGNVERN